MASIFPGNKQVIKMKRIEKNKLQLLKELKISVIKWETTFSSMRDSVSIIDTRGQIHLTKKMAKRIHFSQNQSGNIMVSESL